MHSLNFPSCLLFTLLAASGCLSLSLGGGGDEGQGNDETSETGEPVDDGDDDDDEEPSSPSMPSKTDQPLVDGALWSVRWDTAEPIAHAALAEPGLALANGAHAALLDPADGEPLWGISPFDDTTSVLQLRADELIHGRRITLNEGYLWELRHYSTAGMITDTEVFEAFDGFGPLAIDGDGRVFVDAEVQLAAFDGNGQWLWSRPLTEGHHAAELLAIEDGVVLVEATPWQEIEIDYRLRRFDADGEELTTTGYVHEVGLVVDLVLADARTYVAADGMFGFSGRIHAVEPEFAGLAWTMELGKDIEIRIEPGPDGGLVALFAESDAPARVTWIAADGSVLESRDATTGSALEPLLVVGAGGEVIAGGFVDGVLELSRLE